MAVEELLSKNTHGVVVQAPEVTNGTYQAGSVGTHSAPPKPRSRLGSRHLHYDTSGSLAGTECSNVVDHSSSN